MATDCRNQAQQVAASLAVRGTKPAAVVLLYAAAQSLDTAARQMGMAHKKCLQWANQAVQNSPTTPNPTARADTSVMPLALGVTTPVDIVPGPPPRRVPAIGNTPR
jgi:hypothetical protein